MGDYGFRISKEGVDVKNGDDKDMVVTSKFPVLKGFTSGITAGDCASGSGDPWTEGVVTTLPIYHGLGYIPMFQVFVKEAGKDYYHRVPVNPSIQLAAWALSNTTNLYVKIYNNMGYTINVSVKFYIFLDKAKL